jgi:hypothetical protein
MSRRLAFYGLWWNYWRLTAVTFWNGTGVNNQIPRNSWLNGVVWRIREYQIRSLLRSPFHCARWREFNTLVMARVEWLPLEGLKESIMPITRQYLGFGLERYRNLKKCRSLEVTSWFGEGNSKCKPNVSARRKLARFARVKSIDLLADRTHHCPSTKFQVLC